MVSSMALAVTALVLALATSGIFGGAFSYYFHTRVTSIESRNDALTEQLNDTASALALLQATYLDALMNVTALTPVVTVLSSGTYVLTCDIPVTCTWQLQNVYIGNALNFTVLVLDSPATTTACEWTTFGASSEYIALADTFEPLPFAPIRFANSAIEALSATNAALLETSSGCIASGDCRILPSFVRVSYLPPLQVSITLEVISPSGPGAPVGFYFTSSLHLILPLL